MTAKVIPIIVMCIVCAACGTSTTAQPAATARAPAVVSPVSASPTARTRATVIPPVATATPARPLAAATPVPTLTVGPHTNTNVNLRAGPGTNYPVIGGLPAGRALTIIGRNPEGNWYQISNGAWIFAQLVDDAPAGLPVVAVPTAAPAVRGNPSAAGSNCPCDQGNILNCDDFPDPWAAQSCYLRCLEQTGRDIHQLDRDKDGNACEWGR